MTFAWGQVLVACSPLHHALQISVLLPCHGTASTYYLQVSSRQAAHQTYLNHNVLLGNCRAPSPYSHHIFSVLGKQGRMIWISCYCLKKVQGVYNDSYPISKTYKPCRLGCYIFYVCKIQMNISACSCIFSMHLGRDFVNFVKEEVVVRLAIY